MIKHISILFAVLFFGACGSSIEGKGSTANASCPTGQTRCSPVNGVQGICIASDRVNQCPTSTGPTTTTTSCNAATELTCPGINGQSPTCKLRADYQMCAAVPGGQAARCERRGTSCQEPVEDGPDCDPGTQHVCPGVGNAPDVCRPKTTHRLCPAANGREAMCETLRTSPRCGEEEEEEEENTSEEEENTSEEEEEDCGRFWWSSCDDDDEEENSPCGGIWQSACEDGEENDDSTAENETDSAEIKKTNKDGRPLVKYCEEFEELGMVLCLDKSKCLFPEEIKDGEEDCLDGRDETLDKVCPEGMSPCSKAGTCYYTRTECDEVMIDCGLGYEDEKICSSWDSSIEDDLESLEEESIYISFPKRYTCQNGNTVEFKDACGSTRPCGDTIELSATGDVCEKLEEFKFCQKWAGPTFVQNFDHVLNGVLNLRDECKPLLPGECTEEYGFQICGNKCIDADSVCELSPGEDSGTGLCDEARDFPYLILDGEEDCPNGNDEKIEFFPGCPDGTYHCGDGVCIPMSEEAVCDLDYYICDVEFETRTRRADREGEMCEIGFDDSSEETDGEDGEDESSPSGEPGPY